MVSIRFLFVAMALAVCVRFPLSAAAPEYEPPAALLADTLYLKAVDAYNGHRPQEFAEYAEKASSLFRASGDLRYVTLDLLGIRQLVHDGYLETALRRAEDMVRDAGRKNDDYLRAMAFRGLGIVYGAGRHYDKAVEVLEKSSELMLSHPDLFSVKDEMEVCIDLISSTHNNKEYDSSADYCRRALEIYDRLSREYGDDASGILYLRLYIQCSWAINLTESGRLEEAEGHLALAESDISPEAGADTLFYNQAAAILYSARGEFDKALEQADIMLDAYRQGDVMYWLSALEIKTDVLEKAGRNREALENMRTVMSVKDSIESAQRAVQLNEFYTIYGLNELEKQHRRQNTIIAIVCSVCLLLAFVAIVFIVYSRELKRKNKAFYIQIREKMHLEQVSDDMMAKAAQSPDTSREHQLYARICELMSRPEIYTDMSFGRTTLAQALNTNDKYIADAIHAGCGSTVAKFISDRRLAWSVRLMTEHPELSVEEIAEQSGHGSYSAFLRSFSRKYGMTPSQYRKLSQADRDAQN